MVVVAEAKRARGHSEHRGGPVGDGMDSMRAAHFHRRVLRRLVGGSRPPTNPQAARSCQATLLASVPQLGGLGGIGEFVSDVNRCVGAFGGSGF